MKLIRNRSSIEWFKPLTFGLLLAGIYFSTFSWLVAKDWNREDYSYGIFIPALVLYLIWDKRKFWLAPPSIPTWTGLTALIPGLVLFWLGELSGEFFSLYISFWLTLVGLCWMTLGWKKLKAIGFGLCMLLAMFPLPGFIHNKFTLWLKLISSQIGVSILNWYGLLAYREGNIIDLGFTKLQVADACSGLRYLFPMLVTGLLLASVFRARLWKRAVLVLSTVPLTILTNSLRIAATGVLYETWGPKVAEDFFHGFSGWLIFIFGLAVLMVEIWVLKKISPEAKFSSVESLKIKVESETRLKDESLKTAAGAAKAALLKAGEAVEKENASQGSQPFAGDPTLNPEPLNLNPAAGSGIRSLLQPPQFTVAVALLAATLALSQGVEFREKIPPARSFASFPMQVGEWTGRSEAMAEEFVKELDLTDYVIVDFKKGSQAVNFYTAYYASQRKGESIHSPETCLPGSGWEFRNAGKTVVELDGAKGSGFRVQGSGGSAGGRGNGPASSMTVNRALMVKGGSRQLSYFWFPQRGRVLTNAWELKLYNFWDALTRQRTDGALVRLITPVYPGEEDAQAEARLTAFTQAIVPVLDEFLPK